MCIKEEYKGLSDPDEDERGGKKRGTFGKFFDFIQPKGVPYEKLYDEEGNPLASTPPVFSWAITWRQYDIGIDDGVPELKFRDRLFR